MADAADLEFMRLALEEAKEAAAANEVPIGAIAVLRGRVIARARNRVEERHSVTAHAELELLRAVENELCDWRMEEVTFYVTKEPCPMCAGALVNARVKRIVYGLPDPRCGGCGGGLDVTGFSGQLWHPEVTGGVLAEDSGRLLRSFFRAGREKQKTEKGAIHVQNYQSESYIQRCNPLMKQVFGRTLEHWYRTGAWNRQFECYAKLDGPRMLAQVGVVHLTLLLGETKCQAIELNGVAVSPEVRGRGYARELLAHILQKYASTPAFLFANDTVLDFYPKFGFRRRRDLLPVAMEAFDHPDLVPNRLSPDEARPLLEQRLRLSTATDAEDGLPIALFHLYGDYAPHIYAIGKDLAVVARQQGTTLHISDLFGRREIDWETLLPQLPFRRIERIEFGFTPDRLGVSFHWEERQIDRNLFVRGNLNLPDPGTIPESLES